MFEHEDITVVWNKYYINEKLEAEYDECIALKNDKTMIDLRGCRMEPSTEEWYNHIC